MVFPRRLYKKKRQLLIAVPRVLTRELGCGEAATLYWHRHRRGELVLSLAAARKGAPLTARMDAARIHELERQVQRLQEKLASQREALWNRFQNQERGRRLHLTLKGYPALDAINDRLARIEGQLAELRVNTPRGAERASSSSSRTGRPLRLAEIAALPPGVVAIDADPPS